MLLDYHLVHTLILDKPCYSARSLGVFLNNAHQFLASFAAYNFKADNNALAKALFYH
jgi:hypothetical protein